jgi:hypothetical protein
MLNHKDISLANSQTLLDSLPLVASHVMFRSHNNTRFTLA